MARRLLLLCILLPLMAAAAAFSHPSDCLYHYNPDVAAPFALGTAMAIHLGNTKSCVAGFGGRDPEASWYQFCIPSLVAITNNGTLVGDAAIDNAETVISGFKRLFGLRLDHDVVKREAEIVAYKFGKKHGRCSIQVETGDGQAEDFFPEDVAGMLMSKLKQMAEAHLRRDIKNAVVTVPGHLGNGHRQHVVFAARAFDSGPGFRAVKLVDEQLAAAAAAAYGLHDMPRDGKVILVFHLGGRTADAAKLAIRNGTAHLLSTQRDPFLGGDDFTARVVDYMVELVKEKHHGRRDVRGEDKGALRRLTAECERAKRALSYQQDTLVEVDSLLDGVSLSERLARAKFEELSRDLLARAMDLVERVVMGLDYHQPVESRKDMVDEILLVGGSVRIPKIGELIKDYFHGRQVPTRML